MEIVPGGPNGPAIEPVLRDYRQRYALAEEAVLNVVMEALATGRARSLVAVEGGRPVGAVVLSQQGPQGRLHLLHALGDDPLVLAALLDRAEEDLAHVTATLPTFPGGQQEGTFRQRGYQVIPRARMVLELSSFTAAEAVPEGFRLVPWQAGRQQGAAALVWSAHQTAEDRAIYPDLADPGAVEQFLESCAAGAWGRFDPDLAPMALRGEDLAGLCLTVWHAGLPGQGFILDLAVAAAQRRRGLGRALVVAAAQRFRAAGAAALGLAVTWANEPARRLYQGLGFRVEQRFVVFYR